MGSEAALPVIEVEVVVVVEVVVHLHYIVALHESTYENDAFLVQHQGRDENHVVVENLVFLNVVDESNDICSHLQASL